MRAPPSPLGLSLLLLAFLLGGGCDDDPAPALPPPATHPSSPKDAPVHENRLGKERSPYLRQHKNNPVDWYPWGDEAFARAREEDKPVFLSVGYAACHWCHVMEHESFEDAATAAVLNKAFICVKVDREERPDIDRVYMSFVQMRTGRGGWPMTVLLTPDRKPFWGATYLPAQGLRELCGQVTKAWTEHRKDIEQSAEAIAERLAVLDAGPDVPATDDSDAEILKTMRDALGARFDNQYGGWGTRPKFPPHTELLYFLDDGGHRMGTEERRQVFLTLDAMERGGIHDQVGGGFHRYSTDEHWLLPHFEKMLYDNALLAQAYAGAYEVTPAPRYRRAAERIFSWLEREMKQPDGGYASSLDADTEGEEGLTYTWTPAELKAALTEEEAALTTEVYGVTERGNFADEASGGNTGRSILHRTLSWEDAARKTGREPASLRQAMDTILAKLLTVRNRRAQPGLDDKVITAWNGLLLSAFARAGRALKAPVYLERGRTLARFLLEHARRPDGTLLRFPRGSGPEIPGFCEDHVHLIDGLLDLADATGEATWAEAARALTDRLDAEFQDPKAGGFFATSGKQHEVLIARGKETWDSPIPSDNGVAARVNLRLFARTGEANYRRAADRTLSAFRPAYAHPRMVTGTMALVRAMTMRMELAEAGGATSLRGDVRTRRDVVQVDVFSEFAEAAPGAHVRVVVRIALDEGWHVNATTPTRKDLVGTRLGLAEKAPVTLADLVYPDAALRVLGPGQGEPLALYEGTFEIRGTLVVPAGAASGPRKVSLRLRLQACNDVTCEAPIEIPLELPLRFAEKSGSRRHPALFE